MSEPATPLLQVEDLKVHFPVRGSLFGGRGAATVRAVDGVSFSINRGETFSIVGESGCGKSTTAMAVLRMQAIDAGRILFDGDDISRLKGAGLRQVRRRMQTVFQDPFSSLNPRMKVGDIIAEPLDVHGIGNAASRRAKVSELMALCGLLPDMADRYPHEFSGGQRQRISIARALALEPELVVCDEAVSALDVSIRAQILNLLLDLQKRLGLAYLFISHDLTVVRHISDRIGVMYLGKLVEVGEAQTLFAAPRHPYTRALLAAAPTLHVGAVTTGRGLLEGEQPSARNPPSGCRFHTRCPVRFEPCSVEEPPLEMLYPGQRVACHLASATALTAGGGRAPA
ncbi:ABC transporter ATP-binding protein [Phenylobacterium sp.]|uniref:ABC transporter ATP-binding protein n=1 Tax=Phenylobacterium sp. TaxID=1871053 RepID=UPI0039C8FB37